MKKKCSFCENEATKTVVFRSKTNNYCDDCYQLMYIDRMAEIEMKMLSEEIEHEQQICD